MTYYRAFSSSKNRVIKVTRRDSARRESLVRYDKYGNTL